jgi:anthranilate/para-aminobenzoate synthase component I
MKVIAELEDGPRGVYTGTIGWFADGGGAHLNVAIRTATVVDGQARVHVGAGIVADSSPSQEWAETLAKAGALSEALNA